MKRTHLKHRHGIAMASTIVALLGLHLTVAYGDMMFDHASAEQETAPPVIEERVSPEADIVQPLSDAEINEEREAFLNKQLTIALAKDQLSPPMTSVVVKVREHPEWIQSTNSVILSHYRISERAVQDSLERGDIPAIALARSAEVLSTEMDKKNVVRATTDHVAKEGFAFDTQAAAEVIADALEDDQPVVIIPSTQAKPTLAYTTIDGQRVELELLSTGLSDFADSTPGREHNVHKAIDERVHNVVLAPGETFSLVAALDAPITLDKGWQMALGLFGGGAAPTVGGGICQSATTVYRAALLAGLPMIEKANHSLFVDHYEFYGVGLDATVFPRFHDLRFKNDTDDLVVLQGYTEGVTVVVNLFGKSDGRSVALDGPYFMNSKNRPKDLYPLSNKQIGWVRTISYADGGQDVEPIVASYAKPLFKYLSKKYGEAKGMELLVSKDGLAIN